MSLFSIATHRRGFLGGMAATIGGLLVTGASPAEAETGSPPTADETWLKRIKGKNRQVVDCTTNNGGFGVAYGLNFIDTTKEALGLPESDFTSVLVYRHFAMPLTLNDAMWAKYKIGEVLDIKDPATKAPATKNIFKDSIFGRPGLTFEKMLTTRPVIATACNLALNVISGMAAPKAGVTADQAKADFTKNLIPGVTIVPSGVYAVNRAQQNGCTYCNGG
jgi:hypothetical protein